MVNTPSLILNPAYRLRQDGNRVVIYGDEIEEYHSQEWFSFMHPFYAILLSFFSINNKSTQQKISDSAKHFKLSEQEIANIIHAFVGNPQCFTVISKNGTSMSFPQNLLLRSEKPIFRNEAYTEDEFSYYGKPDLTSNRLDIPLNINLELNMECFTDCCYCYANKKCTTGDKLSTERIKELISEAKRLKINKFDINGGEVMLHPDINAILRELTLNGFKPLISTKIPLDYERLRFLKEIGITKFQISLDAADDTILSTTLKTSKGYLSKISNTLKIADSLGLLVDINTVLTKYNCELKVIEQLLRFLSNFNCIDRVRLNPTGYSLYKDNFSIISANIENLKTIEFRVPEWNNVYNFTIGFSSYDCSNTFNSSYKDKNYCNRALCTANIWNMVILPDGAVTICEELYNHPQFIIGNVSSNSIKEVWQSQRALQLYNAPVESNNSVCFNCRELTQCRKGRGVCWKMVLMAYGNKNWQYPDPRCPKAPFPYNDFFYKDTEPK